MFQLEILAHFCTQGTHIFSQNFANCKSHASKKVTVVRRHAISRFLLTQTWEMPFHIFACNVPLKSCSVGATDFQSGGGYVTGALFCKKYQKFSQIGAV